jgi:hypothetical protein
VTFYCDKLRHIVCVPYSVENLHRMAEQLDLKRGWFHKDHYDMPKQRIAELTARCVLVRPLTILHIIKGQMKRHAITLSIADSSPGEFIEAVVYITAKELKYISHERVIADGVVIDLPGEIKPEQPVILDRQGQLLEPVISIDRATKTYAIFEGFVGNVVRPFKPYTNEEDAIKEATAFIATVSRAAPIVVHPTVTKLRMS